QSLLDSTSFTACPGRNPAVGAAEPGRGGSPSVLGRDGPSRRGAAARDRDPASRRMVTDFGLDPTGLALDMTKLRHLHRHLSEASAHPQSARGYAPGWWPVDIALIALCSGQ